MGEALRLTIRLDRAVVDDVDRLLVRLGRLAPGLELSRADLIRVLLRRALTGEDVLAEGVAALVGGGPL